MQQLRTVLRLNGRVHLGLRSIQAAAAAVVNPLRVTPFYSLPSSFSS